MEKVEECIYLLYNMIVQQEYNVTKIEFQEISFRFHIVVEYYISFSNVVLRS